MTEDNVFFADIIDPLLLPNPEQTAWLENDSEMSFNDVIIKLIEEGTIPQHKYTLPLPYLSVSQVNQYLRCPKQFEFRYIKGIRKPPAAVAVQGTVLHRALEIGYQYKIDNKELPPLDLPMDTFNDKITKAFKESEAVFGVDENEKLLRAQGERLIGTWHEVKLPYVEPVHTERKFVAIVAGIPTVGIIDLIDAADDFGHQVVDNKTVKKAWNQDQADNSLQLSLYSAVTGLDVQRLDLFVRGNPKAITTPGSRAKGPHIKEVKTMRSPQQLLWMVEVFRQVAIAISAGIFPPTAPDSWTCSAKWCGFWDLCRGKLHGI